MKYSKELKEQGTELHGVLTQKAWESEAFLEQLVKNPVATIEQVTGKDLTNFNKKIEVIDQTNEDVIYINIPAKVSMDEMELTEEQLEAVAGGVIFSYIVGAAIGYGICALIDHYN